MSSRRFFRRKQSDVELQQEIELYLAEEIAENVERGMSADEARRQAYLKFGSPRRVREEVWRHNSFSRVESFWRDMRHVLRRLERSPSVVLTVMVSLGLGIAANVFIFTAVNRLVLQAPPVGHPETLLDLHPMYDHGQRLGEVSSSTFDDLREHTKSFSGVAAYNDFVPAAMGGAGDPVRLWGWSTTTNFFEVAELPMALGRGFSSDENRSPIVVLSYSLWRRHFLGDAAIIGKSVSLSGKKFTVIGVMAPGFHGMNRLLNVDFWVPDGEWQQLGRRREQQQECPRLSLAGDHRASEGRCDAYTSAGRIGCDGAAASRGVIRRNMRGSAFVSGRRVRCRQRREQG